MSWSVSNPPVIVSLPAPPVRRSSPVPPFRLLARVFPMIVSPSEPPITCSNVAADCRFRVKFALILWAAAFESDTTML